MKQTLLLAIFFMAFSYLSAQSGVDCSTLPPNGLTLNSLSALKIRSGTRQTAYTRFHLMDKYGHLLLRFRTSSFESSEKWAPIPSEALKSIIVEEMEDAYETFLDGTSALPANDYTLYITLNDLNKDTVTASCSHFFSEFIVRKIQLTAPEDGNTLPANTIPAFTWQRPPEATKSLLYRMRIVVVFPGQTPEQAIAGNPLWYDMKNIGNELLFYKADQKPLKEGFRYAWQITGEDGDDIKYVSNVHTFRFRLELIKRDTSVTVDSLMPTMPDVALPAHLDSSEMAALKKNPLQSLAAKSKASINGISNRVKTIDFEFYGDIRTEYYYSNREPMFEGASNHYLRTYLNPGISLYGVPFSISTFYTTEDNSLDRDMSGVQLQFDYAKFQANMRDRLQQKVVQLDNLEKLLSEQDFKPDLGSLNSLKDFVAINDEFKSIDPKYFEDAAELKKLKVLHSIEGLSDEELGKLKAQTDSLGLEDKKKELMAFLELRKFLSDDAYKKRLQDSLEKHDPGKLKLFKDIEKLKKLRQLKNAKRPPSMADILEQNDTLSRLQKLFLSIRSFEVGETNPYYSRHTLAGVTFRGISIETTPDNFYVAVAGGKVKQPSYQEAINKVQYDKTLAAAKVGYGKPQESHFHLVLVRGLEDNKKIPTLTHYTGPPISNIVVGTEFSFNNKERLFAEGELSRSFSTFARTYREENQEILNTKALPALEPGNGSAHYLKAGYRYPKINAQVSVSNEKVDNRYETLGVPYLIKDMASSELRLDKTFLQSKLRFGSFYKLDHYNITDQQKTNVRSYGIEGSAHFSKLPYVSVRVSPVLRTIGTSEGILLEDRMMSISVTSGYNYEILGLPAATMVNYNQNSMVFSQDSGMKVYNIFTGSQSLILSEKFTAMGTASYFSSPAPADTLNMTMIMLSVIFSVKNTEGSLGITYNKGEVEKGYGVTGQLDKILGKQFIVGAGMEAGRYDSTFMGYENKFLYSLSGRMMYAW